VYTGLLNFSIDCSLMVNTNTIEWP